MTGSGRGSGGRRILSRRQGRGPGAAAAPSLAAAPWGRVWIWEQQHAKRQIQGSWRGEGRRRARGLGWWRGQTGRRWPAGRGLTAYVQLFLENYPQVPVFPVNDSISYEYERKKQITNTACEIAT